MELDFSMPAYVPVATSDFENTLANELFREWHNIALSQFVWKGLTGLQSSHVEHAVLSGGNYLMQWEGVHVIVRLDLDAPGLYGHVMTGRVNWASIPDVPMYTRVIVDSAYANKVKMAGLDSMPYAVRLLDNPTDSPLLRQLALYAAIVGKIDAILRQNVHKQRIPVFIPSTSTDKKAKQELEREIETNIDGFLVLSGSMADSQGQMLAPQANYPPFIGTELMQVRKMYIEIVDNLLGTVPQSEKKERLTVTEAETMITSGQRHISLRHMARVESCNLFNQYYGTNLEVDFEGTGILSKTDSVATSEL